MAKRSFTFHLGPVQIADALGVYARNMADIAHYDVSVVLVSTMRADVVCTRKRAPRKGKVLPKEPE